MIIYIYKHIMSISQLLVPNDLTIQCSDIEALKINGVQGQIIDPDVNTVGQVLTIVSTNPKVVEFQDAQGGLPDTTPFADGYVLKITDSTQNEINWEPDIGGGATIPFILTGNSVNALKVQDNSLNTLIRVDTVDNEVHLSGLKNFVEGVDDINKFSVLNSSDPSTPCLNVDSSNNETTVNGKFLVGGLPDRVDALQVVRQNGFSVFSVDTLNKQIGLNINETLKRGYIKFLDVPEEIYSGLNSSAYMTLDSDILGAGNSNFVGYVAKNGPNSVITAVNNATAGVFFNTTTNAGINTTSENFNIASFNPSGALSVQFNSEISLESNGCILNIGNGGLIKADKKFVIQDSSVNNLEQFAVKDVDGNNVFIVDTQNDAVFIRGNDNSGAKLAIQDPLGNFVFLVDTNNDLLRMGSSAVNQTEIIINPQIGIIDVVAYGSAFFNTKIRCQHNIWNPLGGTLTMIAHRDNTDFNKLESIGASGLTISSDSNINMNATTINITSTNPVEFFASCPKTTNAPTLADSLTNKRYVDDKVGGLSSGTSNSATALGNVVGDQSLNPTSFLPSSPTVPPNYLKAGQSYQLTMAGTATYTNGDAFVLTLKSGAITLGSISITVPVVAGGGQTWELEADFTIRSVTLGLATIVCSFDFTYNDGQDFRGKRSLNTTTTLDTTASNTLEVFVNFSSGQATDNITTQLFILKKVVDV